MKTTEQKRGKKTLYCQKTYIITPQQTRETRDLKTSKIKITKFSVENRTKEEKNTILPKKKIHNNSTTKKGEEKSESL